MTATLTEIRTALAQQIDAGISRKANVKPYAVVTEDISATVITVLLDESFDYQTAQTPIASVIRLRVELRVAAGSDTTASAIMDEYLCPWGDSSIYKAIAADGTLGGTVSGSTVLRAEAIDETTGTASIVVDLWVDS